MNQDPVVLDPKELIRLEELINELQRGQSASNELYASLLLVYLSSEMNVAGSPATTAYKSSKVN